jgi:hypothetical protein
MALRIRHYRGGRPARPWRSQPISEQCRLPPRLAIVRSPPRPAHTGPRSNWRRRERHMPGVLSRRAAIALIARLQWTGASTNPSRTTTTWTEMGCGSGHMNISRAGILTIWYHNTTSQAQYYRFMERSRTVFPELESARGGGRNDGGCRRGCAAAGATDEKGEARGRGHRTDSKQGGVVVHGLCPMHARRKSRLECALARKGGTGNNNGTG